MTFQAKTAFVKTSAILLMAVLLSACGRKAAPTAAGSEPAASAASSAPAAKAPATEATESGASENLAKTLERLTQTVRKFSAENRRVPASLQELVAVGYLPEVPAAPSGKKYVITEELRVVLK
jgi:hypothetical protein